MEAYNEKARSHAKSQAAYDGLEKRFLQTNIANAVDRSLQSAGDDPYETSTRDDAQGDLRYLQKPKQAISKPRNAYSHVREGSSSSNETSIKLPPGPLSAVHRDYDYDRSMRTQIPQYRRI